MMAALLQRLDTLSTSAVVTLAMLILFPLLRDSDHVDATFLCCNGNAMKPENTSNPLNTSILLQSPIPMRSPEPLDPLKNSPGPLTPLKSGDDPLTFLDRTDGSRLGEMNPEEIPNDPSYNINEKRSLVSAANSNHLINLSRLKDYSNRTNDLTSEGGSGRTDEIPNNANHMEISVQSDIIHDITNCDRTTTKNSSENMLRIAADTGIAILDSTRDSSYYMNDIYRRGRRSSLDMLLSSGEARPRQDSQGGGLRRPGVVERMGERARPVYVEGQRNVTVGLGERATLKCRVENLGTKMVTWRKQGEVHPLTIGLFRFVLDSRISADFNQRTQDWSLVIQGVEARDEGVYHCQLSTKFDRDPYDVTLNVKGIQVSGTEYVDSGSPIQLTCNATGRPDPPADLEWVKDSHVINSDLGLIIAKKIETRVLISTLTVQRSTPANSGKYTCRSSTGETASIQVHVLNNSNLNKGGPVNQASVGEASFAILQSSNTATVTARQQDFSGLLFLVFVSYLLSLSKTRLSDS